MPHQFKNVVRIAAAMLAAFGSVEFRSKVEKRCSREARLNVRVSPPEVRVDWSETDVGGGRA